MLVRFLLSLSFVTLVPLDLAWYELITLVWVRLDQGTYDLVNTM